LKSGKFSASLPIVYDFISLIYRPRYIAFNARMIILPVNHDSYDAIAKLCVLNLYADVMHREIEWPGSHQFQLMLYLLLSY
jgi:hypothetical protein